MKRCLYLGDDDLLDEVVWWQLKAPYANGSNQIIGNNDQPVHSHFDLMTIYDKA